jgi:hypothetical protein
VERRVKILTPAEVDEYRVRMLDEGGWATPTIALIYTAQSREGTLRRLYQAVMATPLEGTELTAAMRETEQALGISAGQSDTKG